MKVKKLSRNAIRTLIETFDIENYLIKLSTVADRLTNSDFGVDYELLEFAKANYNSSIRLSLVAVDTICLVTNEGIVYIGKFNLDESDHSYDVVELVPEQDGENLQISINIPKDEVYSYITFFSQALDNYDNSFVRNEEVSANIQNIIRKLSQY